ncbi:MAG: glycosyltransferase [Erysipelotrichales bacterium]|nr:glycosyltransferase [Erysipelotrichales bacterium]
MKKIVVAIVLPSLCYGGAETMSTQLAKAINKSKFEVHFITTHSLGNNDLLQVLKSDQNIKIYSLEEDNGISIKAIRKMNKYLKQIKPDVIHTHIHAYAYVFLYALLHHVKVIHTMHSMPIYESNSKGKFILKRMSKAKVLCAVGISDIISSQIKDLYGQTLIETIYNPVDLERFNLKNKKDHKDFTIITVGRMEKEKNQILLLRAFNDFHKIHNDTKLIIVGDGKLKNDLIDYVTENKLTDYVSFVGSVKDTENYYSMGDVFVLTSIYEGLPMTILEAMACGLPIISTNVGGIPDIVDSNGILIESNDLIGLTNAMVELKENENKRLELGQKSYKKSKKYDLKLIATQYEDLYVKYAKRS